MQGREHVIDDRLWLIRLDPDQLVVLLNGSDQNDAHVKRRGRLASGSGITEFGYYRKELKSTLHSRRNTRSPLRHLPPLAELTGRAVGGRNGLQASRQAPITGLINLVQTGHV